MYDRWSEFTAELESGEADRVNAVIDEIQARDLEDRIRLFETYFDELTELYAVTDDGYVRQSIVRAADQLTPGISTVFALDNDDRSRGFDAADIREQTDTLCGFLLEAITDDDGRVRKSAKRGLENIFRTYDALDDEETIEALMLELDEMASHASGKQEKHLREAKENARFTLKSGITHLLEDVKDEFRDSSV